MKRSCTSRRGTIYVLVLVTASIVTAMGVAGVMVARTERSATEWSLRSERAARGAHSALHLGLQRIRASAQWRDALPAPVDGWYTLSSATIDSVTTSVEVTDPIDWDLSNEVRGRILARATASYLGSRRTFEAQFDPVATPFSCLNYAISVGGAVTFKSGTLQSDGGMACNLTVIKTGGTVNADISSATILLGLGFNGSNKILSGTVEFPSVLDFAIYSSSGTRITYASRFEKFLLSPTSNPFGTPNPRGIYYIDCGGKNIEIRKARIIGTLVLLNTGSGSKITDTVLLQSPTPTLPALICAGPLSLEMTDDMLSEASEGTNFNPTGAAYLGFTDSDQTDLYPSRIDGLVFITGACTVKNALNIVGGLYVAGSFLLDGDLCVARDQLMARTVPVGFEQTLSYTQVPGSWSVPPPP